MHPVRKWIERHAPGSLIPRDAILAEWDRVGDENEPPRWVPTSEACRITGMPESTLRANAPKWQAMQDAGRRPPIHVIRKGTSDRSPWLFDQGDCYAYRRAHGGGPRLVRDDREPEPAGYDNEVDDRERFLQFWERRVTENLG